MWIHNYGQLAINNTTKQVLPVLAKDVNGLNIENGINIEARQYTASIVRSDDTVWTVGYNEYGAAAMVQQLQIKHIHKY